jgi:hypothetical protein
MHLHSGVASTQLGHGRADQLRAQRRLRAAGKVQSERERLGLAVWVRVGDQVLRDHCNRPAHHPDVLRAACARVRANVRVGV